MANIKTPEQKANVANDASQNNPIIAAPTYTDQELEVSDGTSEGIGIGNNIEYVSFV